MDTQEEIYPLTVAVFDNNRAVIGTNHNCVLVSNCQKAGSEQVAKVLHKYPTHNSIANKKSYQLGIFSHLDIFNPCWFIVYDINTGSQIWSKKIYSDNYSAAFSPVDNTIFLCDNGNLSTNENISMDLPYTGSNKYFGIECHPKRKEILYPCSNTTLATYSFESKAYERHYPQITQTDIIIRALYSPEKNYIALLTDQQSIVIYNQKDKSTLWAKGNFGVYHACINPIFIPHSTILLFLTNGGRTRNYFHVKKMSSIAEYPHTDWSTLQNDNDNALINRIDFSHDGSYMLTGNIRSKGFSTPEKITQCFRGKWFIEQKLFSYYRQLKMYSIQNEGLPIPDLIALLIKKLHILLKTDAKSVKN